MAPEKSAVRSLEVEFFRNINRLVEPMVRAGVGSPRIAPSGFIVLETRGRMTGRLRRSPLAATRFGHLSGDAPVPGKDRHRWSRSPWPAWRAPFG